MFAHLYEVTCSLARQRGAIGVFYPIRVYEPANTPEQAEQEFRKNYETQGPPVLVTHTATTCPNCGQWQAIGGDCLNECKRRGFAQSGAEDTNMYTMTLTAQEYRDACYMAARGYLGELTDHATDETWNDDESEVTLTFRESDAWLVQQACEDDPDAVWSLTTPSTTLGRKFQRFIDSIV